METEATNRRRYTRSGLFGQIEDVTYRVLRRMENNGTDSEDAEPTESLEGASILTVNMTFGPTEGQQLGEPF